MRLLSKRGLEAAVVAATAILISCDSNNSTMPPGGNVVPSIAVGVNPQSSSVPQGGSTQVSATITRTNFAGAVALTVSGAPTSISVSITQPPVTGAIATGLITLTATSATSPGTYNLTIQAAGTGVSAALAPFVLTVMSVGSYTLSSSSSGVALAQGASGTVQVAITRDQFASLIDLEAVPLANGVTGVFTPNPVSGSLSTLTLGVGPRVPLGTYNLSVQGSSAGSPQRTVSLLLMVGQLTTFTFGATPVPANVTQGASRTVAITIARGASFTANVALAVIGAPQGLTATLNPASVSGTTSTLTLTAAVNLPVGMYLLTMRAGSAGNPEQTLTIPVIVAAS